MKLQLNELVIENISIYTSLTITSKFVMNYMYIILHCKLLIPYPNYMIFILIILWLKSDNFHFLRPVTIKSSYL